MSTATDLGTLGLNLVGLQGTASGSNAVDLGAAPTGIDATNIRERLERDFETQPVVYRMTGYDTVALTTITWNSYGTPTHDIPPTANPVINISATRIR